MTHAHDEPAAHPSYLLVVLLASGATFLSLLDATIANLAIADLPRSFPQASVADFTWVISLYAILFAAFLAPSGRLADVLGRRALYIAGVSLFTVMSLLCAIAPTLPILLIARAIQGIGAAAMIPASLAIVLVDSPPERRGAAIGVWSAAAAAAAVVGPSLGGILIDFFGWRSVFLVTVPIGIALLLGIRVVRSSAGHRGAIPDLLGTVFLAAGVGLLTVGITEGPVWRWEDVRVLGCLVGGVAVLALAIARSQRHQLPAIETRLWRNRTFALANVVSLFFGAALYAWLLVAALILVNVWHYSWLYTGLAMSPGALVSAVVALTVGRLMRKYNPRFVVFSGALAVLAAGIWQALILTTQPNFLTLWLPVAFLAGFGFGAISTAVSSAAALSVQPSQFAGATGLNMAVRQIGGALGIAALAAILPVTTSLEPAPYIHVILFCCVTVAIAGLVGLGLSLHGKPASAPPRRETAPSSTMADSSEGPAAAAAGR